MRAILLAAGKGTRLRPLTNIIPKCLVPINGRPLINYWLETLSGIDEILINLHYLSDEVRRYIEQTAYAPSIKMVYEDALLGTAGTLLKNKDFWQDGPVILIHADNLSQFDVAAFIKAHKHRPVCTEMTMMTFSTTDPKSCGIIEIDSEGVIQSFYEKVDNAPGNLANAGIYIVEPTIIPFLLSLKKEVIDFSLDVIPQYIGRINTWQNTIYHRDIGTISSWLNSQIEFNNIDFFTPQFFYNTCNSEILLTTIIESILKEFEKNGYDFFYLSYYDLRYIHESKNKSLLIFIPTLLHEDLVQLSLKYNSNNIFLIIGVDNWKCSSRKIYDLFSIRSLILSCSNII